MDNKTATNLAYQDCSIDKIEVLELSHEDLVDIAAMCWKWAMLTNHQSTHDMYLRRAFRILNLSAFYRDQMELRRLASSNRAIADLIGCDVPEGMIGDIHYDK